MDNAALLCGFGSSAFLLLTLQILTLGDRHQVAFDADNPAHKIPLECDPRKPLVAMAFKIQVWLVAKLRTKRHDNVVKVCNYEACGSFSGAPCWTVDLPAPLPGQAEKG